MENTVKSERAKYDRLVRTIMKDSNLSYADAEKFLMDQVNGALFGGEM